MTLRALAVLGLLSGLAGCADPVDPLRPDGREAGTARTTALARPGSLPLPTAGRAATAPEAQAPHVYMALQPSSAGAVSVIFAIDESRDNTPNDDPAIRISPENGLCNPQSLSRFTFPPEYAARPIYSEINLADGVTPALLPNYLAIAVSQEMLERGLVARPEDVKPQNVCTQKLWRQRIVIATDPETAAEAIDQPPPSGG